MRRLMLLLALGIAACEQKAPESAAVPAPAAPDAMLPGEAPARTSAEVLPRPKDQAQLDRMILAGYTPHADHLHAPGVNKCPLTKGNEAVM
jgi:hypothetical protein